MSNHAEQQNARPAEPRSETSLSEAETPAPRAFVRMADEPGPGEERPGGSASRHKDYLVERLKTPAGGAAISGSVVLGAAALFGVLETSLAAVAAYLAYRVLRKHDRGGPIPPKELGRGAR